MRLGWIGFLALLPAGAPQGPVLPRPDHVVIVVEENKSYPLIIGNPEAPYINALAARGALLANVHARTHPSQPNYLLLFSGSTQGVVNNTAPAPGAPYAAPNLGSALLGAGLTFAGYSEDQPSAGYLGPVFENYRRRHNPWSNFANVPAESNLPFTAFPGPDGYDALPTVSFVIPNLLNDMHSATIARGDTWLRDNLDAFVQWAHEHNSLFILTWDESNDPDSNHIPTIFVGPMVRPGTYGDAVDHVRILRTLEDLYGLPHAGESAAAAPIVDIWQSPASSPGPQQKDNGSCGALGIAPLLLWAFSRSFFRH